MRALKMRNTLSIKSLFIFIAASVLILHTPCASAISSSQRKIFNYSIPYYNDCYSGSSGGGAGGVGGGTGDYSGEDVLKFAGFSVGSTFNLSDDVVEEWFLGTGTYAVGHFGLNSSNIGQITEIIRNAGISPAFFYGYTVNEGGGAGGFINHYASDAPGGAVGNAQRDVEYLVNMANSENFPVATGGGEPANMPTAEAQAFLDSLPLGTIGKVYLPSTSAATAEIEEYYGKFDTSTTPFGKPIASLMGFIESMGGNPLEPGEDIFGTSGGGGVSSDLMCSSGVAGTMNEKIVQIATEWAEWGDTYGTCYTWAGGHTSQADTDERIEHHFADGYGVDCSGFASAVIYKASGVWNSWSTQTMCSDTENFKEVDDPQPGDFKVTCNGHVAIILEVNSDGSFKTAESTGNWQNGRGESSNGCGGVGPNFGDFSSGKTLRYIGPGSN